MLNILFHGMPFRLVVVMGCLTVFIATHLYATSPLPVSPAGAGARAGVVAAGDKGHEKGEAARSMGEDHGLSLSASSATTDPPGAPSSPTAMRLLAGVVLAAIVFIVFGGYELPQMASVCSASVSATSFVRHESPTTIVSIRNLSSTSLRIRASLDTS